jgi:tRNA (guanine37-N1)-methyltransferase
MDITIVTLFPEMFQGPFNHSIIKRAIEKNAASISYVQIRDFATDSYKTVDDHPYGGGHGMVMRVDIVDRAISYAKSLKSGTSHTVLLDPQGTPYTQRHAEKLGTYEHLILVCGHYEGIDERIRLLVDEEISLGDYIVTGGELGAIVVVDSIIRLLPGVLKNDEATKKESFSESIGLEYPQYTRPEKYKSVSVPKELMSGNHKLIEAWKKEQSTQRTRERRPDLIKEKKDPHDLTTQK